MAEDFDKATAAGEEDWRNLSKYSGERLADTDLDQQLGEVKPGDKIYHHIQLSSRVGRPDIMEFDITVSFISRCWMFGDLLMFGTCTSHTLIH